MNFQEWINSLVLCAVICGSCLYFLSGTPSARLLRLLCGLIMTAVVILPFGSLVKNWESFSEKALIISDYGNRITTEDPSLGENLILDQTERRLGDLLTQELRSRMKREDCSVAVTREGTAKLYLWGEDFPAEEGRIILSALLGGCQVEVIQGGENGV